MTMTIRVVLSIVAIAGLGVRRLVFPLKTTRIINEGEDIGYLQLGPVRIMLRTHWTTTDVYSRGCSQWFKDDYIDKKLSEITFKDEGRGTEYLFPGKYYVGAFGERQRYALVREIKYDAQGNRKLVATLEYSPSPLD